MSLGIEKRGTGKLVEFIDWLSWV